MSLDIPHRFTITVAGNDEDDAKRQIDRLISLLAANKLDDEGQWAAMWDSRSWLRARRINTVEIEWVNLHDRPVSAGASHDV